MLTKTIQAIDIRAIKLYYIAKFGEQMIKKPVLLTLMGGGNINYGLKTMFVLMAQLLPSFFINKQEIRRKAML